MTNPWVAVMANPSVAVMANPFFPVGEKRSHAELRDPHRGANAGRVRG